jgi:anthranilate synthase component 1
VGVLDSAGNLELCIAIRTVEFEAGRARFRSGAGIVADSREETEWDEIHHKAGAVLAALRGGE